MSAMNSNPGQPSEIRQAILTKLKSRYTGEVSHTRREGWCEALDLVLPLLEAGQAMYDEPCTRTMVQWEKAWDAAKCAALEGK